MLKASVPANGEGTSAANPNLSRRRFLGGVAITAIPSAGAAMELSNAGNQQMTAQERFDFHLVELKRAAEELDPRIGDWLERITLNDDQGCSILITAFRTTGAYEGDGLYESGKENWNGKKMKYTVRLLPGRVDGGRLFEVACPGDRMQMIETRLNTFIGRRLS